MKRCLFPFFFFLVLLTFWEFYARRNGEVSLLLPAPSGVIAYLFSALQDGTLLEAIFVTLKRLFLGYFTSLIVGIPAGLLIARYQFFEDTLGVLALGFQTLPSICWAPLALLWFGQTETAMFFIVVMGSIWSIMLSTDAGVRHVPPIFVKAARTMGSKGLHTWFSVILPSSFPFIISGMKQGWAFAWRSLMAAEIYITILTGFGLGSLLHYGREMHDMDAVVGIMFVIILIGLLIDKLIFSPLEQYVHNRWGTEGVTKL